MDRTTTVAIVGGGAAGLTAALFLRRAGIDVEVFDQDRSILKRARLYNLPGSTELEGLELLGSLRASLAGHGVTPVETKVDDIEAVGDGFAVTAGEDRISAQFVVIATGQGTLKLASLPLETTEARQPFVKVNVVTDRWGATSVPGVWAAGVVAGWPSQATFGVRGELAQAIKGKGIELGSLVLHAEFVGGGFGSKFSAGIEGLAVCLLAHAAKAPVKLMLDRFEEHTTTWQRRQRGDRDRDPAQGRVLGRPRRHAAIRVNATRPAAVAVVVPCFDEAGYVDHLLDELLPAIEDAPHWSLVLVDDLSTDATPAILAAAAARSPRTAVLTGRWGSPGGARSAGVALALRSGAPDWLLTLDADVTLADGWRERWDASFAAAADDGTIGAINGVELQDHLFRDHPNAARVGDAFGAAVGASEAAVGITNLNGVNHAITTPAYLTAGPYLQPTAPGPHGIETLAGEDWDLGVRIRRAGFSIAETDAAVLDRGRRLLSDVHAYVSGDAYEGAFGRPSSAGASGSPDVDASDVPALADAAVDRVLRHFLCKPILAGAIPLAEVRGLSAATLADIDAWMRRWPHPTFDESRNGFVFGRLARFADEFVPRIRTELGFGPGFGPGLGQH